MCCSLSYFPWSGACDSEGHRALRFDGTASDWIRWASWA